MLKRAMAKESLDNLSVVVIAFKNYAQHCTMQNNVENYS